MYVGFWDGRKRRSTILLTDGECNLTDTFLIERYKRRATALIYTLADGDTRCMLEAMNCLHENLTRVIIADVSVEDTEREQAVHEAICVCLSRFLGMREHEISHILTHEMPPCD